MQEKFKMQDLEKAVIQLKERVDAVESENRKLREDVEMLQAAIRDLSKESKS